MSNTLLIPIPPIIWDLRVHSIMFEIIIKIIKRNLFGQFIVILKIGIMVQASDRKIAQMNSLLCIIGNYFIDPYDGG